MQLLGLGQPGRCGRVGVERGLLVRVLAVAQGPARRRSASPANCRPAVVAGGQGPARTSSATATSYSAMSAKARAASARRWARVKPPSSSASTISGYAGRVGHHGHRRRGSWPRPAPSPARRCRSARRTRPTLAPEATVGLERVEVGDQQVERRDAQLVELRAVRVSRRSASRPACTLRVQGLDPAVEALGEAGHRLHRGSPARRRRRWSPRCCRSRRSPHRPRAAPGPARPARSCRRR